MCTWIMGVHRLGSWNALGPWCMIVHLDQGSALDDGHALGVSECTWIMGVYVS